MKLEFENFDKIRTDEADKFAESVKRANALINNIQDVENYNSEKGCVTLDVLETITVYGDDYADEFYVECTRPVSPKGTTGEGRENQLYIEILTAESAERNELECTDLTPEAREHYKLGETVQWYLPLGNSGYWYTLK